MKNELERILKKDKKHLLQVLLQFISAGAKKTKTFVFPTGRDLHQTTFEYQAEISVE
jgi:hypothetical protein